MQNILRDAKPGSAKHKVYQKYFEEGNGLKLNGLELYEELLSEPKTLLYAVDTFPVSVPSNHIMKMLHDHLFALKMDDPVVSTVGFGLQKGSEFEQVFNHYILKQIEHGILKRLHRQYYTRLNEYRMQNSGIGEAQPLSINNVLFLFICLATGILASIAITIIEFIVERYPWKRNGQEA